MIFLRLHTIPTSSDSISVWIFEIYWILEYESLNARALVSYLVDFKDFCLFPNLCRRHSMVQIEVRVNVLYCICAKFSIAFLIVAIRWSCIIVYPKLRPVSPPNAKANKSYPAFFPIYRIGGIGRGWVGVSLSWPITPEVDRQCLNRKVGWVGVTRLVSHPWGGVGRFLIRLVTPPGKGGRSRCLISLGWLIIPPSGGGPLERHAAGSLSSYTVHCFCCGG